MYIDAVFGPVSRQQILNGTFWRAISGQHFLDNSFQTAILGHHFLDSNFWTAGFGRQVIDSTIFTETTCDQRQLVGSQILFLDRHTQVVLDRIVFTKVISGQRCLKQVGSFWRVSTKYLHGLPELSLHITRLQLMHKLYILFMLS